jgi:hypothetical protein
MLIRHSQEWAKQFDNFSLKYEYRLPESEKDPLETKNFYNDPAYAETVKELKVELARLQTEVKETLPPPRKAHGNKAFGGEPEASAPAKKGKGKAKAKAN